MVLFPDADGPSIAMVAGAIVGRLPFEISLEMGASSGSVSSPR